MSDPGDDLAAVMREHARLVGCCCDAFVFLVAHKDGSLRPMLAHDDWCPLLRATCERQVL